MASLSTGPSGRSRDLAGYLGAIGLPQADGWDPTVSHLGQLHRAHLDTFAFASVEPAVGRVPSLELGVLEERIVRQRRGGYCLEHVTLFAAVLAGLGFDPRIRLARVSSASGDEHRPATHLTVLAQPADDDRRWMCDVGFGLAARVPVPVPNAPGTGASAHGGGWQHRVDRDTDGRLTLLERDRRGDWQGLHVSPGWDAAAEEVAAANEWVARADGSPFAGRLIALRSGEERRERLVGGRLQIIGSDGRQDDQELAPVEALTVLHDHFGVVVDDHDRELLLALLSRRDA